MRLKFHTIRHKKNTKHLGAKKNTFRSKKIIDLFGLCIQKASACNLMEYFHGRTKKWNVSAVLDRPLAWPPAVIPIEQNAKVAAWNRLVSKPYTTSFHSLKLNGGSATRSSEGAHEDSVTRFVYFYIPLRRSFVCRGVGARLLRRCSDLLGCLGWGF